MSQKQIPKVICSYKETFSAVYVSIILFPAPFPSPPQMLVNENENATQRPGAERLKRVGASR